MARRDGRPARGGLHRRPDRRLTLLAGAAAVGAIGAGLMSPTSPMHAITADASFDIAAQIQTERTLEEAASRGDRDSLGIAEPGSAQAASAIPQAQARAHTLAEINARRQAEVAAQSAAAARSSAAEDAPAGPDTYRDYARSKVGATQFSCLDKLWNRESNWRPTAQNPSSTAYGIAQLLNSTWAYTGISKTSNGYRQVDAGLEYIRVAYGTPCSAWAHETDYGWY